MRVLGIPPISPHHYPSLSNHGKALLMTSLPGGNPRQRSVLTSVHCRRVTAGRRYLVATAAVNIQGARLGSASDMRGGQGVTAQYRPLYVTLASPHAYGYMSLYKHSLILLYIRFAVPILLFVHAWNYRI